MGIDFGLSFVHAEKLWPFSGTSARLVLKRPRDQRCARKSFPILSPCLLLPSHAVFGQVFNHNLRRTDPSERRSFGSVVKPRRRARAHHPQAREILGGPPHQAVRVWRACSPKTRRGGFEEGPEITVTGATRLKSKHTILPPDTKIVTSSNLASGPFSYHPQHRSQRRRHEKGSRSASG